MSESVIKAERTIHRIMASPYLFCKEVLKIKNKEGRIVPLLFNNLQYQRYLEIMRDYWKPYKTASGHEWNRLQGIRYVDCKFRQWGESTMWCGLFMHDLICNEGTDTLIMCQDYSFSSSMVEKYKLFYRYFPEDLKPLRTENNSGGMKFGRIHSSVTAGTPGASESVADKQGRSKTIRNAHLSEFSKWPTARTTLNAMRAAIPTDGNIFIEASPDKVGDYFHILYMLGKQKTSRWRSHFSPWHTFKAYQNDVSKNEADHIMSTLNLEEQILVHKFGVSVQKIAWRREQIQEFAGDMKAFFKEYPEDDEKCFEISSDNIFEAKLREKTCEQRETGIPGHIHCIGADIGAGIEGGDWSTIEVIDTNTMENCYSWRGHISPDDMPTIIHDVWKRFPGLVGIEANGLGNAAVSASYRIMDWQYPAPGFLFANNETFGGWLTTGGNKNPAVFYLRYLLLEQHSSGTGLKLGSQYVSDEMKWFQHLPRGGIGSPGTASGDGGKLTDDSIMALVIASGMIEWVPDIQKAFMERFG